MKITQADFNAIAAECALEIASILKRNGIEVDCEAVRVSVHNVPASQMPEFKQNYGRTESGELIVAKSEHPVYGILCLYQEYQK